MAVLGLAVSRLVCLTFWYGSIAKLYFSRNMALKQVQMWTRGRLNVCFFFRFGVVHGLGRLAHHIFSCSFMELVRHSALTIAANQFDPIETLDNNLDCCLPAFAHNYLARDAHVTRTALLSAREFGGAYL